MQQQSYLSQKLSNLELWSLLTTYRKSYTAFQSTPYCTPKIQDGWNLPPLKLVNCHISSKNHPTLMKFGTQQHIWNSTTVTWPNMKILEFKQANGRHVDNRFLAISLQPTARSQWNYVHQGVFAELWQWDK